MQLETYLFLIRILHKCFAILWQWCTERIFWATQTPIGASHFLQWPDLVFQETEEWTHRKDSYNWVETNVARDWEIICDSFIHSSGTLAKRDQQTRRIIFGMPLGKRQSKLTDTNRPQRSLQAIVQCMYKWGTSNRSQPLIISLDRCFQDFWFS